jgi:tetratricopeptide (TPR) repeat protein
MTLLSALALGEPTHADTIPRTVLVMPFEASSLAPDEQWMGEGVAHIISMGLAQHPAFVQIERSGHADVTLHGRIRRNDTALLLQPLLVARKNSQVTTIRLHTMTIPDGEFLTHVAALPVAYAEALQITLTDGEKRRIGKAALPTRSLRALELYTRGQIALDRGASADSVDLLVRAIDSDARFAMAQYMLGRVHAALGSRWKAAAQYRAATLLDRAMPEPYKALGDLFLVQPRRLVNLAIEAYSWAINLRPFYADALIAYSRAFELDPRSTETRAAVDAIAGGSCIPVGP